MVGVLALYHRLVSLAIKEPDARSAKHAFLMMLLVIVLMTGVLRRTRPQVEPDSLPPATEITR